MIIKMPDDIYAYEEKSFGNFTSRQIKYGAIGMLMIVLIYFPLYMLSKSIDISAVFSALIGIPIILCGFLKRDGVYLDEQVKALIRKRKLSVSNRPYKVQNNYFGDIMDLCEEALKGVEVVEKKDITTEKPIPRKNLAKKRHFAKQHTL